MEHLGRGPVAQGLMGPQVIVEPEVAEYVERLARILYNHRDRKDDSRTAVMFNNLVTECLNILTRAQDSDQGRLV